MTLIDGCWKSSFGKSPAPSKMTPTSWRRHRRSGTTIENKSFFLAAKLA